MLDESIGIVEDVSSTVYRGDPVDVAYLVFRRLSTRSHIVKLKHKGLQIMP